jgi:hypothetical protein
MKNRLFTFLILLLVSNTFFAQKITIQKDLKVKEQDFRITRFYSSSYKRTEKVWNEWISFSGDTLTTLINSRGLEACGLQIQFIKNKVIPKFFYATDGGYFEESDFESYDLTLNATNFKLGDTLYGIFRGSKTKQVPLELEGAFIHVIQDTREKERKEYAKALATKYDKKYLDTGLYDCMAYNVKDSTIYKYTPHKLIKSDKKYLPYEVFEYSLFHFSAVTLQKGKPGFIKLKFAIEDRVINDMPRLWQFKNASMAFIYKDTLLSVFKPVLTGKKYLIVTVPVSSKTQAEEIFEDVNEKLKEAQKEYKKYNDN